MNFLANPIFHCTNISHFVSPIIHQCMWLNCFHLLLIVNNAVIKTNVHISLQVPTFNYFWYILRSNASLKKNLRNQHTVFHSCYTIHIPTNREHGLQILNYLPKLVILFSFFFGNSSHNGHQIVFNCEFDYIFLIISDIEHLFICLFIICISSLEKCSFKSFADL